MNHLILWEESAPNSILAMTLILLCIILCEDEGGVNAETWLYFQDLNMPLFFDTGIFQPYGT